MSSPRFHPFGGKVSRHFGSSLAPDDAYLSYYDVRLTKEDVDCMRNDWLTDNAIAFWQEYLEHDKLSHYPNSHINLLRPSMAFMLTQTPDPRTLRDALPDFTRSTHIFLPVNDSRAPDVPEGGSHWSLLVVSVVDGVAFHYDSLSPSNHSSASLCCHRFSVLLGRPLRFIDLRDSPQQENGSDCGVFVCMSMMQLLRSLLRVDANGKVNMSLRDVDFNAGNMRREMIRLVEEFRRQGQRSSSRSRSADGRSHSRSPPRVGD